MLLPKETHHFAAALSSTPAKTNLYIFSSSSVSSSSIHLKTPCIIHEEVHKYSDSYSSIALSSPDRHDVLAVASAGRSIGPMMDNIVSYVEQICKSINYWIS